VVWSYGGTNDGGLGREDKLFTGLALDHAKSFYKSNDSIDDANILQRHKGHITTSLRLLNLLLVKMLQLERCMKEMSRNEIFSPPSRGPRPAQEWIPSWSAGKVQLGICGLYYILFSRSVCVKNAFAVLLYSASP
jgi:hypothetical protein